MTEKYMKALIKCRLFNNIDSSELKSLLSCLQPVIQSYSKNEIVVNNGDKLDSMGIILDGEAAVFKESISGNKLLLKKIGEGEVFGEVALFAGKEEWPATVQAITSLAICYISRDRIISQCSKACRWHSLMIGNILEMVSKRALMLSKKLEYISIKNMRSKLCTYIYEQYSKSRSLTVVLPLNRIQLADFLNVSRPSMSRELATLRARY